MSGWDFVDRAVVRFLDEFWKGRHMLKKCVYLSTYLVSIYLPFPIFDLCPWEGDIPGGSERGPLKDSYKLIFGSLCVFFF